MSLKDIRSECSDASGLLQPYVDGELAGGEEERVVAHLEDCGPCRSAVSEQMWVRATLRAVERERAPSALRAKILLRLDEVDDEEEAAAELEAAARAPKPGLWSRIAARSRDFVRGGLILVPAAGVAGALFLVAQGGLEPVETMPASGLSAALTESADAREPKLPNLSKLQPKVEFPIQVAKPGQEPRVQLVGARLDSEKEAASRTGARLRYRVLDSEHHVIDRQRAAGGPSPTGTPVTFRGQHYLVGRADNGEPVVHFERGGVAHMVRLEAALARHAPAKDAPEGSDDFSVLLDLADHLARSR